MVKKLQWISQTYRGMHVHAAAFAVTTFGREIPLPAPKWGYLVVVREIPESDDGLIYGPATDQEDYYTREAAQLAAIHNGKQAIDVLLELG